MANTRFNPSANGCLHLGHVFTLLVNEYQAHTTGGKFYVRFDDNSPVALMMGDRAEDIVESQLDDIQWLDVPVDGYSYQSDEMEEVTKRLKAKGWETMTDHPEGHHPLPLSIRMGTDWIAYPYAPQQTVERVMMDNLLKITHVIRGDDFLTEFSLYCYFCEILHIPTPKFSFLPRLHSLCGDISKTNGGYTLIEFRSLGYTSGDIKAMLSRACLIYPADGWELYNIRKNPRINV